MNDTIINMMIASGVITIGGQWAQGKKLTPKIVIGTLFAAFGLTMLGNWNPAFAKDLAVLVLVTTVIVQGGPLLSSVSKAVG